jgi:tRNA-specific 2-thiouridylase
MELFPTRECLRPGKERTGNGLLAVMMSGGVDSSVAAWILKRQGWDLVGITLQIPMAGAASQRRPCCGRDAALVAHDLGIPHFLLDTREAFGKEVIERFRNTYLEGRTPNPCVDCNTIIKFRLAWDFLEGALGITHLATGHYSRVIRSGGETFLARAAEERRDQSYFLYGIPRERLDSLELPLGEMRKEGVRELALAAGLHIASKPDSMELCFAAEGNYRKALSCEPHPGPIVDSSGRFLGNHAGIENFTVGQRSGLPSTRGRPLFVKRIERPFNRVVVGTREELYEKVVAASEVNVLVPSRYREGERLYGKMRSGGKLSECSLDLAGAGVMEVRFSEPQFAPAPGQRIVLYDENGSVVAGGVLS